MLRTDLIAPIPELLHRHAAAHGSKCAYRDAQTSVTYAALDERTGKLAGHLADNGIAANDTVAIFLPNSRALGRKLFRHRPRRRDQRADQLRLDRSRNRLSARGRQLQGGVYGGGTRRPHRAPPSLRTQSQDADRD